MARSKARPMTQHSDAYSHSRHVSQVQAAARERGLKGAQYAILSYICSVADFGKPVARVSRDKIGEKTGYCEKTIKAALASLRAAGFIEAIAYATGGKGRCPVYVIRTTKGGENFPPIDAEEYAKGGKKTPPKGGKNFHQRGEKTSPPSGVSPYISPRVDGAAYSGGRVGRGLDGMASHAPAPDSPEAAEMRKFSQDVARHGYAEARRLQIQRQEPGQA